MSDRFIQSPLFAQAQAEIVRSFRVIRLDFQGLSKMDHCLIDLTLLHKGVAKIVLRHPRIGILTKGCLPECFGIGIHLTLLPRQYAQHYQQHRAQYRLKNPAQPHLHPCCRQRQGTDAGQILVMIRHERIQKCVQHNKSQNRA
jgi:hypothetical protein